MARLDAIRMFLAFACYKDFKVYQMEMKSAFFNGELEEEVYIEQPKGFLLSDNPKGTAWTQTSTMDMVL